MQASQPIRRLVSILGLVSALTVASSTRVQAKTIPWSAPTIELPARSQHPVIACTSDELARLRAAVGTMRTVDTLIENATAFLDERIVFPPRGGQHNQWYQCDKCQLGLTTLSPTQHQCPKCKKIYFGEPYDDVVFKRTHQRNFAGMRQCAWAYAITRDRQYARKATEVLLGYADRYLKYPYHSATRNPKSGWGKTAGGHIDEQTLGEASLMTRYIAPAYDLIGNTLTESEREKIRTGLILPMLKNIDKNKSGKSNWQTWHNAAMLWGGAVIGDGQWVTKAITAPGNGFVDQMEISVTDDGMWYENSWGYHFYTLSAMVEIVEGARRLGIDLWSHPKLKRMFTLPVHYSMSGGTLPRFGDDVNSSARRGIAQMEAAYHAYQDPAILALLDPKADNWNAILLGRKPSQRTLPMPQMASEVFPSAGHAILRTHGPAGLSVAMTFGPYGGFHGHFDKLSFVFYGHGQELAVDPGRARSQAYRLPIHTNWYKATIGHNTVLVDRQSQQPAAGRLECFAANDHYAAVVARCDDAYPGVQHRRMLVLTPNHLVVFDELNGDKEHRFEWIYHNRGSAVRCDAATQQLESAGTAAGFEYIENTRQGTSSDAIRLRFVDEKVTTHLTAAAERDTAVLIGDGPCASVLDRVPMIVLSRVGKRAVFAAVIEPIREGRRARVRSIACDKTSDGYTISGDGLETISIGKDGRVTILDKGQILLNATAQPVPH